MHSSTSHPDWREARRYLALWSGVLTGPIVWLCLLELNYVLAHVACVTGSRWFLHAAVVAALAIVVLAGFAAWSVRVGGPTDHAITPPGIEATLRQQLRWMRMAGVVTSAWFVVVILAMEIPITVLEGCR